MLALSAGGLTATEVAAITGDGPETVRLTIQSAMLKLGARSKLEAIVLALRRGLIDLPEP